LKLAFYSQLPDETDTLDAIAVKAQTVAFGDSRSKEHEVIVQTGLHALTGNTGAFETSLTLQAISEAGEDYATAGLLIHRLGDSFAHRELAGGLFGETGPSPSYANTYKYDGWGHLHDGHTPDVIQRDPKKYQEYVRTLTQALSAYSNGLTPEQLQARQDEIVNELSAVANIETEVEHIVPIWGNAVGVGSRPKAWQEYVHKRSDEELDALSITKLHEMIGGMQKLTTEQLKYLPEVQGKDMIPLLNPFSNVSPDQAVNTFLEKIDDKNDDSPAITNVEEMRATVKSVMAWYVKKRENIREQRVKENNRNSGSTRVYVPTGMEN
jgi:hypothetical protein